MNHYKEFNSSFKFFVRDLIRVYPDVLELKLMLSFYKVMKTVNKKAPQKYFSSWAGDNAQEIINKNWDFFFNKPYDDTQIQKFVDIFRKLHNAMDEENKDMIWKHLLVLLKVSQKCDSERFIRAC
jgi:hypothetical protein